MLSRLKQYQEIVVALVNEDLVMKALDYALEHNVHSMRLSSILDNVEMLRENGDDSKAAMIVKRLQELKKFDEAKMKSTPSYRPLLLEE
jgi:UV DNA damage repair endonuclease